MKRKIITLLLASAISISLVACNDNNKQATPNDAETSESMSDEKQEEKDDSELSQAEWMEKHADEIASGELSDGNGNVEKIDLDTGLGVTLKYTGYEILDKTDLDGNPIKQIAVICDFTNTNSEPFSADMLINTMAFQDGIEIQGWGGFSEGPDYLLNASKRIKNGATLPVGFVHDLSNLESPVEFTVETNSYAYEEFFQDKIFSQTMMIELNE